MFRSLFLFGFLFGFVPHVCGQRVDTRWIMPPSLAGIDSFQISSYSDLRYFLVYKDDRIGVFDRSGRVLVPLQARSASLSRGGWIQTYDDTARQIQVFNAKGKNMTRAYDRFQVMDDGTGIAWKHRRCGVIDVQGKVIVPMQYERYLVRGQRYIFIKGTKERIYTAPPFDLPRPYRPARTVLPGYLRIGLGYDGVPAGFTDLQGDTVVPPIYWLGDLHPAGLVVASLDAVTWGVMDLRQHLLYPFSAEEMGKWTRNGLLPLRADGQWGVLRFPEGEVVIPFGRYESIETYDPEKEWFQVQQNRLRGLVNARDEVLLPIRYDYIGSNDQVTTLLYKNRLRGYWYQPGGQLVEPAYRYLEGQDDSLCIIGTDTAWALVEVKSGQFILPFSKFLLQKAGPYFVGHRKYDPARPGTADGLLHTLYDRRGRLLFGPDSVDISVFPDSSYFLLPHPAERSLDACEHRDREGKTLRRMPRLGTHIRDGFWIASSRNTAGKFAYNQFSYLDPPGREERYQQVDAPQENLCRVRKDDRWGFTDFRGRVVIRPVFEAAEASRDGYIRVLYRGKWGILQNPVFRPAERM